MKNSSYVIKVILLAQIAFSGLLGCVPEMYKSPMSGDVVAVTFLATELNKRSIFYVDEAAVVNVVEPVSEKELGMIRLLYSAPKQMINVYAGKPVVFVFSEVDPQIGYTVQCHGEVELTPERNTEYLIKYDFVINQDTNTYGECYAEVTKIPKTGEKVTLKRKQFDVVTISSGIIHL